MKMQIEVYKISGKTLISKSLLYLFILPAICFSQVLNGSFEIDEQPSLEDWVIFCNDGESFQDAPSGGGTWCIRFLAGNLQGCFPRTAEQTVLELSNGDIVEVSVWAKQDEQKLSQTSVYLKIFHSDKTTILSEDTTTSIEWTQLTFIDTLFLEKDDSVAIVLNSGITSGPDILDHNSYFDLVEIKKIGEVIVSGTNSNDLHPREYRLLQNYPNPFNPSTTIEFTLPSSENVRIEVYDITGQKVEILLNENLPAGYHEVEFNAKNLSSGIYFYRIEVEDLASLAKPGGDGRRRTGKFQDVKKMILLR
jgi:hypothetical protein